MVSPERSRRDPPTGRRAEAREPTKNQDFPLSLLLRLIPAWPL
jgi:hypothetical protein